MAYHRERGADTRIIRIFNTYGPRMDPHDGRVVISFIRQALHNEPLTVFGDGMQTRSLCYVTDLVEGINLVMESDFVEPINLGNPSELTILDIGQQAEPALVARLAMTGDSQGMLLSGDRLTVFSSFTGLEQRSAITIIDVSDPTGPSILERTLVDGKYSGARAVGDQVFLVLRDDFFLPPPMAKVDQSLWDVDAGVSAPFLEGWLRGGSEPIYETREEYLARIEDQVLQLVMPASATFQGSGEPIDSGWLLDPSDVYRPESEGETVLASVVVFNPAGDQAGPAGAVAAAVSGAATEMHLSSEGLFVLNSRVNRWSETFGGATYLNFADETSILKFTLDAQTDGLDLSAKGSVPGRLLDQFSFDVEGGLLRVATTSGDQTDAENNLFVLEQSGAAGTLSGVGCRLLGFLSPVVQTFGGGLDR